MNVYLRLFYNFKQSQTQTRGLFLQFHSSSKLFFCKKCTKKSKLFNSTIIIFQAIISLFFVVALILLFIKNRNERALYTVYYFYFLCFYLFRGHMFSMFHFIIISVIQNRQDAIQNNTRFYFLFFSQCCTKSVDRHRNIHLTICLQTKYFFVFLSSATKISFFFFLNKKSIITRKLIVFPIFFSSQLCHCQVHLKAEKKNQFKKFRFRFLFLFLFPINKRDR